MLPALGFLALAEVVGLAAAPLAALALGRLPGAGLGFAKPLGFLLFAWAVWMLGIAGVEYGTPLVAGVLGGLVLLGVAAALRQRALAARLAEREETRSGPVARRVTAWIAARALPARDPARGPLWLGAEVVFLVSFVAMALLVSYSPDVWGTEKPMDMAFVNAVDASSSFPPHDPWMSGEQLNYYYLGHLLMAAVIRVVGTGPTEGYNLSLALLFALSATGVFALAGTVWAAAGRRAAVAAGVVSVVVCLVLGNLAGVREWFEATDPPAGYDWFAPSRVIPGTINEFPWFSFTAQDLHAHVLAVPFTLLALAFALQVLLRGPRGDAAWRGVAEALAAGLAVGALYAINSWSYPVAAGVLAVAVVAWLRDERSRGRRGYAVVWLVLVALASVVVVLPFWLEFDPGAEGLGFVEEREPFGTFAGDLALMYGVLAWPLVAGFAARITAVRRPWRTAAWAAVAVAFAGSLLALADLTWAGLLFAAAGVALAAVLSRALPAPERFLWLLISAGLACVALPEVVYVRDAFEGGPFERMNTVFKLGYQAHLLLGVAAALALGWAGTWLGRRAWPVWAGIAAVLLLLAGVYPYAGTYARKDGFVREPSLDGIRWLAEAAPGDPPAIDWLRENAPGDAVVLEAVGEDYSAFGHGRISTYTGRPAVLGWAGHELQWSHDPGRRRDDVRTLYATPSAAVARPLLARYGIAYVVLGPLERTGYGQVGVAKWSRLGKRVFARAGTEVYELGK